MARKLIYCVILEFNMFVDTFKLTRLEHHWRIEWNFECVPPIPQGRMVVSV